MSSLHTVAVLGLGRMGTAIARRLAADGRAVVGWTRSGRTPDTIRTAARPDDAVAQADVVVLALFDGAACRQVLDEVRASLRAETVVVNTSTIAPDEAADLARSVGSSYVHAPVLGSVPAAAAGALQILAAGEPGALDRARPILDRLGTVRSFDDATVAAALKLIANHSLAGAVLALSDSLRQADALGVPRNVALDVLELGQLGGLVNRKRAFLAGDSTTAPEFTVSALAKDLTLLADASDVPLRSAAGVADQRVDPRADIATAVTVTTAATRAVLEPLRAYVRGHATHDPAHFRDAFLPTAYVEGIRDHTFVSWSLDEYCALFDGVPAADESTRSRRIDTVDVQGTVATATMTLLHGPDTFTDVFLLVEVNGDWQIANKAYHRRPGRMPQ